jgi:hypothetical protein
MNRMSLVFILLCLAPAGLVATPGETLERAITAYAQAQAATRREERLAGFRQAQRLFEFSSTSMSPGET